MTSEFCNFREQKSRFEDDLNCVFGPSEALGRQTSSGPLCTGPSLTSATGIKFIASQLKQNGTPLQLPSGKRLHS